MGDYRMRNRKDIEELEDQLLAPFAMKSKDAGRRVYDEAPHETRTGYQRDRDRIVHSEAFRKLEYKTQVFVIFEGDYYRTRLTHTIEVAQIGRTIGRNLQLNEDLIEAIALAHDLGHPPFGHAGEDALNDIMRKAGLPGFNHNKRSYEIVSRAEKRYPNFPGLNLTQEVRVGILKHQSAFDIPTEDDDLKGVFPTLEAQVVDIADSLAYLNHDIDDGLTSGYLTEEDLCESELWQVAVKKISMNLKDQNRDMLKYQIVKELIDTQVKDLLEASSENLEKKNFKSSSEVKKCSEPQIGFSKDMSQQRNELQNVLSDKLYHHFRVERMTEKAKRIIDDLFKVYIKKPTQLPYAVYQRGKKYKNEEVYEVICNHIAGMTDRFALDEHKKLFNPYEKV